MVDPDGTISAIIDTPATDNPQWGPEAIAFDPQTKRVFSVETNGDVTIIDATTNAVIRKQKVWSMGDGAAWPISADMLIDRGGRRVVSTMRFGPKKVQEQQARGHDRRSASRIAV